MKTKCVLFATIFFFAGLSVFGGNAVVLANAASGDTQTVAGGGVTVAVTYTNPRIAEPPRMQVTLNTHSVDLDDVDLKSLTLMRDDTGKTYAPEKVENKAHSQIVATPVVPKEIRRKYEVATGYYDDTDRCLYCDMVDDERKSGERIVLETNQFVVFHPFASRVPFETWIAPKRHQPSYGQVPGDDLLELAHVLKRTLSALPEALSDPDYNYIIHSAPVEDESKRYYLWHLQIIPRLTGFAGFELGSGMSINTALPEETARFIREVI